MIKLEKEVLDWLMEGDASVQFQVLRDLTPSAFTEEKKKELEKLLNSPEKGEKESSWVQRILSFSTNPETGEFSKYPYKKWDGTVYTLLLLKKLGCSKDNEIGKNACKTLVEKGMKKNGSFDYSLGNKYPNGETCIASMSVSILSYFKYKDKKVLKKAINFLLGEQMEDFGWNCLKHKGHTHSSFHTTISALEALKDYQDSFPEEKETCKKIRLAIANACEYFLKHRVYKSTKNKVFDSRMARISFPPRWHFDFLRILDFFWAIDLPYDERMDDALDLLKQKQKNGKWRNENPWNRKEKGVHFELEKRGRKEYSRINTLRAYRVLLKYQNQRKRKREESQSSIEEKKPKKRKLNP